LQLHDGLGTKPRGGTGRAKASIIQRLCNRYRSPTSLGQLLNLVADLRIGAQVTQLANWSDHHAFCGASPNPLDAYLHTFAAALHVYGDAFNQLFE
jgi:hypothetical protein